MPAQSDPEANTVARNSPSASNQTNPTSRANLVGMTLGGRYFIERELGRGGMGAVYLARDKPELHSRPVVVKVLLEEALKNELAVSKFYQEIESLTRLDDPGVIGIFDAGRLDDGTPYLVMQYVEGTTLRTAMKSEGMDLRAAAAIIRQVGRSITAAHDAGILHRDLKPENIMVRMTAAGEEHVKIIDFGIAKVKNSIAGPSPLTGLTVGTIAYMSPEQLSAKALTPASDIYSLGVIAYEMVTGRRPFTPDSMFQLLEMQRGGVRVKPSDLRPNVPEAAQQVLLKALAFDPSERFQRAQDFGDQLAAALSPEYDLSEQTTREIPTRIRQTVPNIRSETVATQSEPRQGTGSAKVTLETAHVLFMDIVSYSKLPIEEQTERLQELQDIVRNTQEFQTAQLAGQLLSLPTGDGMALSFFGDPEAPVRCAVAVSRALQAHTSLKLRMGVHSGPVYRLADINASMNIAGGGINMAQRVMDCGDAGHIILSKRVAEDLGQLSRWAKDLHDLGEAEVKHGVRVHVFNLYNDEIGNSEVPEKLRAPKTEQRPLTRWIVVAAGVAVILSGLLLVRTFWRGTPATHDSTAVSNPAADRAFTYFLTPSDKRAGAAEERFAGNEQFHNGSRFTFVLIPQQSGSLYLLNKGSGASGSTAWNVLFPTPRNNNGSSLVAANQRVEVAIRFDAYSGDENLSIIWSEQPVPSLETIFKDAARTDWEIKNPAQIETLTEFLNRHQTRAPKAEVNSEKKETTVSGQGEVLISTRVLKHREF